jgi:hypothetical protein
MIGGFSYHPQDVDIVANRRKNVNIIMRRTQAAVLNKSRQLAV